MRFQDYADSDACLQLPQSGLLLSGSDLALGISSCGSTEVVKETVGVLPAWKGEGKGDADFMALSQDETAHRHVTHP